MSRMRSIGLPAVESVLCSVLVLAGAAPVAADPKPLSDAEKEKINQAIDKGVEFLKRSQQKNGTWYLHPGKQDNRFGYTLLPALALLESGVPVKDPCIQSVANLLRKKRTPLTWTYELSLAVLFLDRLGDPQDEDLIRELALRLLAAQCYTGGWNYTCPALSKATEKILWTTLRAEQEQAAKDGQDRAQGAASADKPPIVPGVLRVLAIYRDPKDFLKRTDPVDRPPHYPDRFTHFQGTTDNSNTQFAMLALWAARRHGLPLERTARLLVLRFENSQQPDGSWVYHYPIWRGQWYGKSPAMTTVGLLGLAIGHGLKSAPGGKGQAVQDPRIEKGFAALSRAIGEPTDQMTRRLPLPESYFLWSVERVAVLYNLPQIGEKDWYRWGAEILVTNQAPQGAWPEHDRDQRVSTNAYFPVINTSFALLFLKRSNLSKDLTAVLPFKPADLNRSIIARVAGLDKPAAIPSPDQGSSKP